MKKHYTVTLIEEYPIYESAEGGYYYTGQECQYIKCKTRKEAQKILNETAEDYGLEKQSENCFANYSKYIGESVICRIEKKNITRPSGRIAYC